ncbi:MAG TPA: carbon-nitrogen hydrolase family protein [Pyrinomonadaceae bacterium]|jgi:predicted amidohydrolase
MKICVVQMRPLKGDVRRNIEQHKRLIDLAASDAADTIIFPELSLTGYEPELAKALATEPGDGRFDDFQRMSDARQVTVGVGAPLRSEHGICISMLLFQPRKARQWYAKKYLHRDEEPFFVSGQSSIESLGDEGQIAPAICYELSVPEHAERAAESGARVYLASVAKSARGVKRAVERLSEIAIRYSMTVLMSNCVGRCDNFESAGQSAVWNEEGLLLGQLNETDEGLLIFDTETRELIARSA